MYTYNAKLLRVLDGDTIEVDLDLGFNISHSVKLRLRGINTPDMDSSDPSERGEARKAKLLVEDILKNHQIKVTTYKNRSGNDVMTFNRYVADVIISINKLDGTSFDACLVDYMRTMGF